MNNNILILYHTQGYHSTHAQVWDLITNSWEVEDAIPPTSEWAKHLGHFLFVATNCFVEYIALWLKLEKLCVYCER